MRSRVHRLECRERERHRKLVLTRDLGISFMVCDGTLSRALSHRRVVIRISYVLRDRNLAYVIVLCSKYIEISADHGDQSLMSEWLTDQYLMEVQLIENLSQFGGTRG